MQDKRNSTIAVLMRAILDKQIPFKDVIETNISLTKRTGLHHSISNSGMVVQKIIKNVADIHEVNLTLG